jgi:hypothetical protein
MQYDRSTDRGLMNLALAFLILWSTGHGVKPPQYGMGMRMESSHIEMVAQIITRHKRDAGDGWAIEGSVHAGDRLKVGANYRYQHTSAYSKNFLFPSVRVRIDDSLILTGHGPELLSRGSRWGVGMEAKLWHIRIPITYTELDNAVSMGIVMEVP